jgi:hypothetical protein
MAETRTINGKTYSTEDLDFNGNPYEDATPIPEGLDHICDDFLCDCMSLEEETFQDPLDGLDFSFIMDS